MNKRMYKAQMATDAIIEIIKELQAENKAWETNYQNLLAQHEEISAIAYSKSEEVERYKRAIEEQKVEIEEFAKVIYHTWDNIFRNNQIPESIKQTLEKARKIVIDGGDGK